MGNSGADVVNGNIIRARQSFWEAHINAQAKSGLSIAEYCRSQGIARTQFYYWKKKIFTLHSHCAGFTSGPKAQAVALVQVGKISIGKCDAFSFRLRLRSGHEIEVREDFSESALSRLLRVMEGM